MTSPGRAWLLARHWLTYQLRLQRARLRWRTWGFGGSPILFGNALPKSGSKLLLQILEGISQVAPFRPAWPIPVRTITYRGAHRDPGRVLSDLNSLQPGAISAGYLPAHGPYREAITREGWASFLLIRDPRDLLVSHVYYATEIYDGHSMHSSYSKLADFESRLTKAILGMEEYPFLPSVAARFEPYLPYLEDDGILLLRFEDLRADPRAEIGRMLDWIGQRSHLSIEDRQRAIESVVAHIDPARASTFRKGQPGEWKHHFGEVHRELFRHVAPDLLAKLGYETSEDW